MAKIRTTLAFLTKGFVRCFIALALVASMALAHAQAAENPKVVEAMTTLKTETAKLGVAKLEGDDILFGATKMGGNYTLVDAIKTQHGATATIFAKKGTNYVRITTNVMKEGQRAVGSILDPSGPAYASINQGKPFYGLVDILGKMYDTGYEPIKSGTGEVIGILYVGFLAE